MEENDLSPPFVLPYSTRGVEIAEFADQSGDCGQAISLDITPQIDKITNRNEHVKVILS